MRSVYCLYILMRVHDFVTGAARLLHTNADTKNTLAQRRRVIKNKCMCVYVGGWVCESMQWRHFSRQRITRMYRTISV